MDTVDLVNKLMNRFLHLDIPPQLVPQCTKICMKGGSILIVKDLENDKIMVYANGNNITD